MFTTDEEKVVPIWTKTGIIPSPQMPADRVHSGLLLSLLARVVAVHSELGTSLFEGLEKVIKNVISDDVDVDFAENKKFICVEILAQSTSGLYGYSLYIPKYWLGQLGKN
jgi:hypothetical protein